MTSCFTTYRNKNRYDFAEGWNKKFRLRSSCFFIFSLRLPYHRRGGKNVVPRKKEGRLAINVTTETEKAKGGIIDKLAAQEAVGVVPAPAFCFSTRFWHNIWSGTDCWARAEARLAIQWGCAAKSELMQKAKSILQGSPEAMEGEREGSHFNRAFLR